MKEIIIKLYSFKELNSRVQSRVMATRLVASKNRSDNNYSKTKEMLEGFGEVFLPSGRIYSVNDFK